MARRVSRLASQDPVSTIKLIGNATNRALLAELSRSPSYPRALADRLGLSEDHVQRKLRSLEEAGLVHGAWAHFDRTVKQYEMTASALIFDMESGGVTIWTSP